MHNYFDVILESNKSQYVSIKNQSSVEGVLMQAHQLAQSSGNHIVMLWLQCMHSACGKTRQSNIQLSVFISIKGLHSNGYMSISNLCKWRAVMTRWLEGWVTRKLEVQAPALPLSGPWVRPFTLMLQGCHTMTDPTLWPT